MGSINIGEYLEEYSSFTTRWRYIMAKCLYEAAHVDRDDLAQALMQYGSNQQRVVTAFWFPSHPDGEGVDGFYEIWLSTRLSGCRRMRDWIKRSCGRLVRSISCQSESVGSLDR